MRHLQGIKSCKLWKEAKIIKKISYNSSTKFSSHHEGPPTANLHTVPSGKESLLKRADGSKVFQPQGNLWVGNGRWRETQPKTIRGEWWESKVDPSKHNQPNRQGKRDRQSQH